LIRFQAYFSTSVRNIWYQTPRTWHTRR